MSEQEKNNIGNLLILENLAEILSFCWHFLVYFIFLQVFLSLLIFLFCHFNCDVVCCVWVHTLCVNSNDCLLSLSLSISFTVWENFNGKANSKEKHKRGRHTEAHLISNGSEQCKHLRKLTIKIVPFLRFSLRFLAHRCALIFTKPHAHETKKNRRAEQSRVN